MDLSRLLFNPFSPRPLVVVEDRVYHISELLGTIQRSAPQLSANLTVVCLDRAGPDTDAAIQDWRTGFPELQIASRISDPNRFSDSPTQVFELPDVVFTHQNDYCKTIAGLIQHRGLLIQDIDLESLQFISRERWWDTTLLASTVRGIVGDRAPKCAFISNKRGYEATFGSELLAAGHDPRDVMNKYEMERVVVPFMSQHLESYFPWQLHWISDVNSPHDRWISQDEAARRDIESELDLVLWPEKDQTLELGGRALDSSKKPNLSLSFDGNEATTWHELIQSRLSGSSGVSVQAVGQRVAPTGALRAEVTNAAARHIHSLRKRLVDSQNIVTVQGHYRLADHLKVGMAERRERR